MNKNEKQNNIKDRNEKTIQIHRQSQEKVFEVVTKQPLGSETGTQTHLLNETQKKTTALLTETPSLGRRTHVSQLVIKEGGSLRAAKSPMCFSADACGVTRLEEALQTGL